MSKLTHTLNLFKDIDDVEIIVNINNYIIVAILKSGSIGKLINRISGLCLLISSLPGSASRMHVESFGKPRDSTSVLETLPGKLDMKRHSPTQACILYI